jgi:hypothetical protein
MEGEEGASVRLAPPFPPAGGHEPGREWNCDSADRAGHPTASRSAFDDRSGVTAALAERCEAPHGAGSRKSAITPGKHRYAL